MLQNIAAVSGCDGCVGGPVAQVIALWGCGVALERVIDLSLRIDCTGAIGIVRGVAPVLSVKSKYIGDAGATIGIPKIVVLPIDPRGRSSRR